MKTNTTRDSGTNAAVPKENKMLPVQPAMCGSCIFRTDGKAAQLAPGGLESIQAYLIQGTPHICHHAQVAGCDPGGDPLPERTCRGGRDYQLKMWHRMGMIDAPTDAALAAKMAALGLPVPPVAGKDLTGVDETQNIDDSQFDDPMVMDEELEAQLREEARLEQECDEWNRIHHPDSCDCEHCAYLADPDNPFG